MADSYFINDIPISQWGLQAGVIGSKLTGYALSDVWSLPKRLGDTFYNWQGDLEPYVDADDIHFDGRDLTLSLVCKAISAGDLHTKINAFKDALNDNFTLSHPVLGNFNVGLKDVDITVYGRVWAQLKLKLRESNPIIATGLPTPDNGNFGIDRYSWAQLGFVVKTISDRYQVPNWQPLAVTTNPMSDSWTPGYRQPATITISGTIKGATYADFKAKVDTLQALISAPDTRTVRYFDGSVFDAFCEDGFEVEVTKSGDSHWGKFNCKMITL